MAFWETENVLLLSGTVERILTKDTQIYSKIFLGIKISRKSIYGTDNRLVIAVFPEFLRVASFVVYTLHPTMFYQSGVYSIH